MNFGGTRADAIRDRQSAAPCFGNDRAGDRRKQRQRIAIGNRYHGNRCGRRSVFDRQTLRIRGRADARRERIAHELGRILHAAALHAFTRTQTTLRIRFPGRVAVVTRIGINDAADRAMFGGDFRLDSAPRVSVARDNDRALHRNSVASERFVIFGNAVVHVDERPSHVAIGGIRVVGRKLFRLLIRRRIFAERPAPAISR